MEGKTISAVYSGGKFNITGTLWQYDYGQELAISGLTLPQNVEVQFSQSGSEAITIIGETAEGVTTAAIPNAMIKRASTIGVYIFLHEGYTDGETEYAFGIPVNVRSKYSDITPTLEESTTIGTLVTAMNDAVSAAADSEITAEGYAQRAEQAAGNVEGVTISVNGLPAGSAPTASFDDWHISLGIPKGDKGDTGQTGATGATGNGIASIAKTGTSGLVDTYTITYTNGNTTTFTVTNGAESLDTTLTVAGKAADAKATGDAIDDVKGSLTHYVVGKNLIGPYSNIYYPVFIPKGEKVTWSFSDGSELVPNSFYVYFYDKDKNQVSYYGAISNYGYTSRTVTPSNSTDIYYIRIGTQLEKSLQLELGDVATTYEPYFPNPLMTTINLADVINTISASKTFTVSAGSAHSSQLDKLPFAISAGEKYLVYIDGDGFDDRGVSLYTYDKATSTSVLNGVKNRTFYTLTASVKADSVSLYLGSGSTNATVTLHAIRIDSFDAVLANMVSNLAKKDVGLSSSHFSVNANSAHSAQSDQIALDISEGEYYYVTCTGLNGRAAEVHLYNDDGGVFVSGITDNRLYCFPSEIDAKRIGLTVGTGSTKVNVSFMTFKQNSIFSVVASEYDNAYSVKLANAKRKANSANYANLTSPEIFAIGHFSDIHGSVWSMREVQRFKDTFGTSLDDTICTGDLVADKITDGLSFWDTYSDGKTLICIGNHDSLGSNGWSNPVSQETLYDTFIAPYKDNWNAETVEDHSYWYKDYADKKIRLIAVDGTIFDETEQTAQLTWLASALSGAKTNSYSVIGAVHFPPMPTNYQKIDCNFSALLHGTATDMSQFAWEDINEDILDAVDTFISGGGEFICWLTGHTHSDLVSYDSQHPKQLFITVSCARDNASWDERTRDYKNGSGLILNTVCVDVVRKYIKLLRYGAEWDDCLRHTGTCVINYSTSPATVMYQN